MKRILIFSLVYYPRFVGGAEVAIKEITDRFGDSYAFDMITLRKHASAYERIGNVNVYRVGWSWRGKKTSSSKIFPLAKILFPFFAVLKAQSLHKKNNYDLSWGMMAAFAGFAALFFKLLNPKVPFLLTLQEGDPISYIKHRARFVYPLFKMIFTKADMIQAISNYLVDFGRNMGFKGPAVMIPNGVDYLRFSSNTAVPENRSEIKKNMGVRDDGIVLVTTSRLVKKNAADDVIRSLTSLPSNVHFVILGTGPDRNVLEQLAKKENVASRVHFIGFVSHEDMPLYLHASDIFIRPSLSEGMGNSFIEAMAAGLPVIATPVGGIPDFLKDGKTGIFCEVNNPKSIAEKVNTLITDRRLREKLISNASKMAREKYDWNLIAKDMKEKVFEQILK